ncbi:hypothetical protein B0H63DRAFT_143502 [Podospora didyma]|uniref:Transmembrane protein n=1 Tax=Podospora didyma TaxID=330526 RepID=A0AAE0U123_9PEZI|nr:hypothetical protein B0H63DRAFT_143502 [Podospora didyma]
MNVWCETNNGWARVVGIFLYLLHAHCHVCCLWVSKTCNFVLMCVCVCVCMLCFLRRSLSKERER